MTSKISHLSELESILCNNEKTHEGVLHFFSTFKIGRFLGSFGSFKSKGFDVSVLLLSLIIFRLRGESICRMQTRSRNFLEKIDDNTFYRLMNNPWMDWRKLLMGFAKQFAAQVRANGDNAAGISCFVLDDTDIEKTGKTMDTNPQLKLCQRVQFCPRTDDDVNRLISEEVKHEKHRILC